MIKVADFGLTEDMYGTNYYRRMKGKTGDDEKVPIRWMPPESIENNIYNEMTDVVRNQTKHLFNWYPQYSYIYFSHTRTIIIVMSIANSQQWHIYVSHRSHATTLHARSRVHRRMANFPL